MPVCRRRESRQKMVLFKEFEDLRVFGALRVEHRLSVPKSPGVSDSASLGATARWPRRFYVHASIAAQCC
jgi:hypothetical protein